MAVAPSAPSWAVSELIVPIEISLVNLDSAGNLNLEETFERLALQWKVERGSSSSLYDLVACPAYQSILALGQPVIPFILQRLRTEGDAPDQWFWALHKLTGVNPIPEEHEGNYRRMKEDWINWATSQHHGR